jgi:Cu/Ag efflux pump CusA
VKIAATAKLHIVRITPAGSVSATLLPRSFLPSFNEGTLTISMLLRPGISLADSNKVGLLAERLLLQVPEVKTVGRRTGRAELDEHAEGVHSAEIGVVASSIGSSSPRATSLCCTCPTPMKSLSLSTAAVPRDRSSRWQDLQR